MQISSITADNVDVYKNAVSKMSDAMDLNIKVIILIFLMLFLCKLQFQSMYTMMAKTEEVTQAMKTVQNHAARMYPLYLI